MLEKIIESCYYVTNNAKDVFINYDVLDNFILNIDCNNLKNWLSYNPFNILDLGIEKIVNFLLLFEAIDYSFWGSPKWSVKAQDMVIDGSEALLYKLLEYGLIEETGKSDLPGKPMSYRTTNDFLKMFGYSSLEELPELPKYKLDENKQIVIDDIIEENEKEAQEPEREDVNNNEQKNNED